VRRNSCMWKLPMTFSAPKSNECLPKSDFHVNVSKFILHTLLQIVIGEALVKYVQGTSNYNCTIWNTVI
jgi:hypothetical protein